MDCRVFSFLDDFDGEPVDDSPVDDVIEEEVPNGNANDPECN